ncbi:hypothetical protein ETU08_01920 [Apibacter muscae]|uniref:AAA family ATPase n=1 Tax=Apibacter muscae TaxID=2509004 RepID=UPI0011AC34BD|nr:AAA family ATPase [Apibacter muscae]TWP31262.1 hypothetical protein ETU08_01920 [Apibacter muscae]
MKTEVKNQIITELENYLSVHKLSANEFSKKAGINSGYISALRNGKETASVSGKEVLISDKWYKKIAEYIGLELEQTYWEPVPTEQFLRTIATLEDAKKYGYTNVIIGSTGSGKSFTADIFVKQNPVDTFKITVGSSDTIGDLIDKVIEALKIPTAKTKSKKIREIVKKLKQLKYEGFTPVILFDEAEYMKQPALCAMKELYDNLFGICSIILIGTDQLTKNLDKLRKKNKDGIPQLYRRIKFGIRVLPSIDKTFKQFLNGIEDKGLIQFLKQNCDNYGELHDVLVPAMREADRTGEPLTENFVRTIIGIPNI